MKNSFIVILLIIFDTVCTQRLTPSNDCPRVARIQNFDFSQFIGTWYVMSSYPDKYMKDARCATVIFSWPSVNNNNSDLGVFRKVVSYGVEKKYLGSAINVQPGLLNINFPALCKLSLF